MKANYRLNANHIESKEINIDKNEVLRYLNYKSKDIDETTNEVIKESISELQDISELKYVYRIFNIEKNKNRIDFENEFSITSKDLYKLLENCEKVAVIAATLGLAVEKKIRYYSLSQLSKGIIFDTCATAYIEGLCDYVEEEIAAIAREENCGITFRYSPGYGDVPITHQADILKSLNANKLIGLTASDTSILIPRKSVTAFIGFDKSNSKQTSKSLCSLCGINDNCSFAKEGEICGKKFE